MIPDVAVVGAGCAGLSAATALAARGARVRLLEARPVIGGRARSWLDPVTGDVEDNGQHVVMACYEQFLAFVHRTGGAEHLRFQERFEVASLDATGRLSELKTAAGLPPAASLAAGLLTLKGFPWKAIAGLSGLVGEARRNPSTLAEESAASWLERHKQDPRARQVLWDPLILATLNARPEESSASLLAAVLRLALAAGSDASRIGFASTGLDGVIAGPARRFLESRRAEVLVRRPAVAVELGADGRFRCVRTRDGGDHPAGAAVIAVPHREASRLVPPGICLFGPAEARALGRSPIVAVHLWLDRPVLDRAMIGLRGSDFHWLFDRARIAGARPPGYVAAVASAADGLVDRARDEIVGHAFAEIRRFLREAREARLLRARVLKEREATPRLGPGSEGKRPPAVTSVPNLVLAGDWTATGLPATLEGAAASGRRAADALLGAV